MEPLKIRAVEVLEENLIVVELSNGATTQVTLDQVLRLDPNFQAYVEQTSN